MPDYPNRCQQLENQWHRGADRPQALRRGRTAEGICRAPQYRLVRRDGRLFAEQRAQQPPEKKPTTSTEAIRAQIADMVRKELPALSKVYNEAMQQQNKKKAP
jgi:hypothetical protein